MSFGITGRREHCDINLQVDDSNPIMVYAAKLSSRHISIVNIQQNCIDNIVAKTKIQVAKDNYLLEISKKIL